MILHALQKQWSLAGTFIRNTSKSAEVKNTFIDGHTDDDGDAEAGRKARKSTCPDVSPSLNSETTAFGDSPASETPNSTLNSSCSGLQMKVEKTFFKVVEAENSPRGRSRNLTWGPTVASSGSVREGEDTPRGDRPGTLEQWPEYQHPTPASVPPLAQVLRVHATEGAPQARAAQPQAPFTPCINLCSALPSVHPAHPAFAGPLSPAGMASPYAPYPLYAMPMPSAPTAYPPVLQLPQLPPATPWVQMDHLVQAHQAAAISAAMATATLYTALAAPVLQPGFFRKSVYLVLFHAAACVIFGTVREDQGGIEPKCQKQSLIVNRSGKRWHQQCLPQCSPPCCLHRCSSQHLSLSWRRLLP